MNTKELKEKYDRFTQSLTDSEYDLFCHMLPNHWKIRQLKAEVD